MSPGKFITRASLVVMLCLLLIPAARGEDSDTIWCGLILATNQEHPKEASPALAKYLGKLKNIFNYNQYDLLGEHLEAMNNTEDHWLIPRKDFFMHVDLRKAEKPGFYRMKLDLYQEKKLLGEMEVRLTGQNLFFIHGPEFENGRIIIILLVK